jgi:outer membrane protein OmpA-like peptidoglycan-associated protein
MGCATDHACCDRCKTPERARHGKSHKARSTGGDDRVDRLGNRGTLQLLRSGQASGRGSLSPRRSAEGGLSGPARELPRRAQMERAFGVDLGAVRAHLGGEASSACDELGAEAFTLGHSIAFRSAQPSAHVVAHEVTHVLQQGQTPSAGSGAGASVSAADSSAEREAATVAARVESGGVAGSVSGDAPAGVIHRAPPNPRASPPPGSSPVPAPGSFAPLGGTDLAARTSHGMSTDAGPMTGELDTELFPPVLGAPPGTGCLPQPATLNDDVADALGPAILSDIPSLAPVAAPDPMPIAAAAANEAMPIIASHYAPHAPSRSPAAFMANVSVKPATFADSFLVDDAVLGEFLEWYCTQEPSIRTTFETFCGVDLAWFESFAGWLRTSAQEAAVDIVGRCRIFETFQTTNTNTPMVQFGRGFETDDIPHTMTHEAMHVFQHPDLDAQIARLQHRGTSHEVFTEGFAEYLARGVTPAVVDAMLVTTPGILTPAQASAARADAAYGEYFDQTVRLRDILYRHGQDGEEAIRRAFFLGEGWRFGLLDAPASGSPIETDRPVPQPVDLRFSQGASAILDTSLLDGIVLYARGRGSASIDIVGRTCPTGLASDNLTLGADRADAVKTYLAGQGIDAGRITTSSRGEADQIPGGPAANRRATVRVVDPRNEFATRIP